MEVSVEVAVLSPAYTVKASVNRADDLLDWIQKNIDKTGKHVLCGLANQTVPVPVPVGFDGDATGDTNLFNATTTTNVMSPGDSTGDGGEGWEEDDGYDPNIIAIPDSRALDQLLAEGHQFFRICRLSAFEGGHLRIKELRHEVGSLGCVDLCNAILPKTQYDDVYARTIALDSDANDPILAEVLQMEPDRVHVKKVSWHAMVKKAADGTPLHLYRKKKESAFVSSLSEGGTSAEENTLKTAEAAASKLVNVGGKKSNVKGVPGFGYRMDYRLPFPSEDYLRETDVDFWEQLGEGDTPWEIWEVRGRQMMVAFLNGDVPAACSLFMEGRVDISVRDSINSTLLHWAIFYQLKPIVAKLIDYQCDVDHKNDLNETPLLVACQDAAWPIFEVLLDKGPGRDPKTLPGDLDSQDLEKGQAPLLWCVRHNNLVATHKLINLGCDINVRDNDGTCALHIAVFLKNIEIVKLLLYNKAETNYESHVWKTALRICVDAGQLDLTDLLLAHGAKTIRALELSKSLEKFD